MDLITPEIIKKAFKSSRGIGLISRNIDKLNEKNLMSKIGEGDIEEALEKNYMSIIENAEKYAELGLLKRRHIEEFMDKKENPFYSLFNNVGTLNSLNLVKEEDVERALEEKEYSAVFSSIDKLDKEGLNSPVTEQVIREALKSDSYYSVLDNISKIEKHVSKGLLDRLRGRKILKKEDLDWLAENGHLNCLISDIEELDKVGLADYIEPSHITRCLEGSLDEYDIKKLMKNASKFKEKGIITEKVFKGIVNRDFLSPILSNAKEVDKAGLLDELFSVKSLDEIIESKSKRWIKSNLLFDSNNLEALASKELKGKHINQILEKGCVTPIMEKIEELKSLNLFGEKQVVKMRELGQYYDLFVNSRKLRELGLINIWTDFTETHADIVREAIDKEKYFDLFNNTYYLYKAGLEDSINSKVVEEAIEKGYCYEVMDNAVSLALINSLETEHISKALEEGFHEEVYRNAPSLRKVNLLNEEHEKALEEKGFEV